LSLLHHFNIEHWLVWLKQKILLLSKIKNLIVEFQGVGYRGAVKVVAIQVFKHLAYLFQRHFVLNRSEGVLAEYDTENKRAKRTVRIHKAHKVFDKKTGGYLNGQEVLTGHLVT